jgi:hypothetical protein
MKDMKKLMICLVSIVFLNPSLAEEDWYTQLSLTVWTRNFEEASPRHNNDGYEKTEGGFTPALGYRHDSSWAFELEFFSTMDFTVREGTREGTINMMALTLAPKYTFSKRFINDKLSLFAKVRIGYTKIIGTGFFGNNGSNSSYTMGPALGADYDINSKWQAYIDIGGLWAAGDIENFDFHPWQIGSRFYF